ncbi:MAG: galactokinase [Chitinophagales bacterium]
MKAVKTYFAPGRINLIGEHLDYNGGLVLPAAINMGIKLTVKPCNDDNVTLRSATHPFSITINLKDELQYEAGQDWTNYPIGIIHHLKQEGTTLSGSELFYESNLPEGAGLSSSAAVEIVTAFALLSQTKNQIDLVWLANFCKDVENNFIGVKCGIMDQYAVALGKKENALLIDCATLKHEYVPLELNDYRLVIMNTKKPRSLIHSKYNERKAECEAALQLIKAAKPDTENLANASPIYLDIIGDEILRKRAKHVVTENLRVKESVKALRYNDLSTFGRLMNASHASLRDDYEVSGIELDTLVEEAQKTNGCLGARMTGAGFGGCAIAIVHNSAFENFKQQVSSKYVSVTGIQCEMYIAETADGVKEISAG